MRFKHLAGLTALTGAAFLINGYHPFSEDAETYLPGIEKILNPHLFPVGSEYFQMHAHLTLFPNLIAYTVKLGHIPFPWALLMWQAISYFLFILACWKLARCIFPNAVATWAGLSLVTVLSTMPVAGTALYLMDPFLNPRNIIAFAHVFAVLRVIERRYVQAALFLLFGFAVHPLMTVFAASFCLLLLAMDQWSEVAKTVLFRAKDTATAAPAILLVSSFDGIFKPPSKAYELVAINHRYQFLTRWTWYEILGAIAPVFIFWGFAAVARARRLGKLELLSHSMMVYGAFYFVLSLIVSVPHRFEVLGLLQPTRSLHLLYIVMLLIGGALLGEYVLQNKAWRWVALFLPLSAGMCYAQRALYPQSQQIEWPGAQPKNPWAQAFVWVRNNTPEDAVFAIDPLYMSFDGEDSNGFRAIAQRSQLADYGKDSGVVDLFPQLADPWLAQVNAQTNIERFNRVQFARIEQDFGANWVVLRRPNSAHLDCPYINAQVEVCRLP